MKNLVFAIAAVACLMAAPLLIAPAAAQVSVGVANDGPRVDRPRIRIGPNDDRARARAEDRGRHYGRSNRDNCREVSVRTRHPDGSMSVTTRRRCN
jgi:hypothetical protein